MTGRAGLRQDGMVDRTEDTEDRMILLRDRMGWLETESERQDEVVSLRTGLHGGPAERQDGMAMAREDGMVEREDGMVERDKRMEERAWDGKVERG